MPSPTLGPNAPECDGHPIYVEEAAILNEQPREAYRALRPDNQKVD